MIFSKHRLKYMFDSNGQVLIFINNITISGCVFEGNLALLQSGGQLMGLRSNFGLAPVPTIGNYQFGGFANLSFLKPTAGREALSRESIDYVTRLIVLAEQVALSCLPQLVGQIKIMLFYNG